MKFTIQIDATQLTYSVFRIPDHTDKMPDAADGFIEGKNVRSLELEPGAYNFLLPSSGNPLASFKVESDGTIKYDKDFEGVISGLGSNTLTIVGYSVTVDASALGERSVRINVGDPADKNWITRKTITLALANYTLEQICGRGDYINANFDIKPSPNNDRSGIFVYDKAWDEANGGFFKGLDTNTLTLVGYKLGIDTESFRGVKVTLKIQDIDIEGVAPIQNISLLPQINLDLRFKTEPERIAVFTLGQDGVISFQEPYPFLTLEKRDGVTVLRLVSVLGGQVIRKGEPVSGITVRAYDRDLGANRIDLGSAISDDAGFFMIPNQGAATGETHAGLNRKAISHLIVEVSEQPQPPEGEQGPAFQLFRLPDGQNLGQEVLVSDEDRTLGIRPRELERLRIVLTESGSERALSEYERLLRAIASLLPEAAKETDDTAREKKVCAAAKNFDEEQNQDISFVAREIGWERQQVEDFAAASRLSDKFGAEAPPAAFYCFARSEGLRDVQLLLSASIAKLDAALRRAVAENIIAPLEEAQIVAAVETIARNAPQHVLEQQPPAGQATLDEVLSLAIKKTDQRAELLRLAAEFQGAAPDFWRSLKDNQTFKDRAENIQYAAQLGTITQNNVPFMKLLQSKVPQATSLRSLAFHLDEETLKAAVNDKSVVVPESMPGDADPERRQYYAEAVTGLLRNAYPGATVARIAKSLASNEGAAQKVTPQAAQFLEKVALGTEDFDPATSRIADFKHLLEGTEAEHELVLGETKRIQRLFRVSTSEQNFTGLLQSGFQSSFDITQKMTRNGFIRSQAQQLGGEAQAELTYRRAAATSAANLMLAVTAYQMTADAMPKAVQMADDATPNAVTTQLKETPTWAQLFGSVEMCECEHCRSWLSPAAYFVDLLLFLDQQHSERQTTSPLTVLLGRRPDLQHLKLSCENTNTTLPYIDLVNEVLESYIALGDRWDTATAHDVTDETAAELRALPQHVEAVAYDTLAEADYPIKLPFNRWLEMARAYLGQFGLTRREVLAAFKGTYGDAETAKRREWLSESLGISAREHEIITGADFAGGNPDRPVKLPALFGIEEGQEPDAPALLAQVPEFLKRTGLSFVDLVDLLKCRFINPAQALYDRLEMVYATFGVTSKDLRAFLKDPADPEVSARLKQNGKEPEQLKNVLDAEFPADQINRLIVLYTDAKSDNECDPATMSIQHLNAQPLSNEELSRVHVFTRLWRKLDWTMADLDKVLLMFNTGDRLTPECLENVALFEQLRHASGESVASLLGLWGDLDTYGGNSLYRQLFLNRAVLNPIDADFALRPGNGELKNMDLPEDERKRIDDKAPAILAALRIRGDELMLIQADAKEAKEKEAKELDQPWLSLANLSVLYRYALLARLLKITVGELIGIKQLARSEPFESLRATIEFGEVVEEVRQSGFTIPQLQYLYGDELMGPATVAPSTTELDALAKRLSDGLFKIDQEHETAAEVAPDGTSEEVTTEMLQAKLGLLLDPERVTLALALIEGRTLPDDKTAPKLTPDDERTKFVTKYEHAGALAEAAAKVIFLEWVGLGESDLEQQGESDLEQEERRKQKKKERRDRMHAAMQGLLPLLREVLGRTFVKQTLSEVFSLDTETSQTLLENSSLLKAIGDGKADAVADFLSLHGDSSEVFQTAFKRLHKIALLVRTLKLTKGELSHFNEHLAGFGVAPAPGGFVSWQALAAYVALRDRLTPGKVRLLDVLSPNEDKLQKFAEATGWSKALVEDALASCGKNGGDLNDQDVIATLERIVRLGRLIGVAPRTLRQWAVEAPSESQAHAIVNAVKGKYDESGWLEIARSINDPLRERQRDALVNYVLAMPAVRQNNIETPNRLFEHFLIDVEMSACMLTSRIKQAISSVQLFVQRCLLNLEPKIVPEGVDSEQWQWRKNYRVWEANRKIFLYPENWSEPELRDNKSPFFKDLESELLQGDVNNDTVERALLTYLEKLDSVARLEVCGSYWQRENNPDVDVLHVFARSMNGIPRGYYYRRLVDGKEWTPWELLTLDIHGVEQDDHNKSSGVHLLPVVWRGKLHLFWPQFRKENKKSELIGKTVKADQGIPIKADSEWKIELAWSRYEQGRWTPKQISGVFARLNAEWDGSDGMGRVQAQLSELRLGSEPIGKGLAIQLITSADLPMGVFTFSDPHSSPQYTGAASAKRISMVKVGDPFYMHQQRDDSKVLVVTFPDGVETKLLGANRGAYYVNLIEDLPAGELAAFYQDAYHCYFAKLSARREATIKGFDPTQHVPAGPTHPAVKDSADASPWHSAAVRLLRGALEGATVQMNRQSATLTRLSAPGNAAPLQFGTTNAGQRAGALLKELSGPSRDVVLDDYVKTTARWTVNAQFMTFFHPHASTLIQGVKRQGLRGLFNLGNQLLGGQDETFKQGYQPVPERIQGPYPKHDVDFLYEGAYSNYNWELFFHVPLLIATRLSQNQRFAEAQRWFHYIFDPTDSTPEVGSQRFWKVAPLRDEAMRQVKDTLDRMFRRLQPGDVNSDEERRVVDQLNALAKHPFEPHRIARMRPSAYQKHVVMKYLDNLIAWGDQLFRRDTIESINEATQIYVLAANLLGSRPERIPRNVRVEPKSFAEIRPVLDEARNAMQEMESGIPFASLVAPVDEESGVSALLSMGRSPYFCIPQNDKLLNYWDVVADRLFKIRHCMNIEGVVRQLALFEPPIDPALLVKAAAAGVDPDSVLSALASPLPRYRFNIMLQKALEMCGEVKALGSALLAALEKKDGEGLALMRAQHESALLKEVKLAKEWQLAEAKASLNALRTAREMTQYRLRHYGQLLGGPSYTEPPEPAAPMKFDDEVPVAEVQPLYEPTGKFQMTDGSSASSTMSGAGFGAAAGASLGGTPGALIGGAVGALAGDIDVLNANLSSGTKMLAHEHQELYQSFQAASCSVMASNIEAMASVVGILPNIEAAIKPLGAGAGIHWGSTQLVNVAAANARLLSATGAKHNFLSSLAGKLAGFIWREREQALQFNTAALEIKHIDKQIVGANIRVKIAEQELDNHVKQIERAEQIEKTLSEKYTHQELYDWMVRQVSDIFFHAYQLAYDLAKKAERCYGFELGLTDAKFIQFGYWDSLKKGLLSGESLHLALKQMERAYLDQNRREYEITRHVSLLQLDPLALVRLRQTGTCEFQLPETLFDLDFPGHYFRRIKSVSITVPCVVGPYTSVSGTLTLLNNRLRLKAIANDYPEKLGEDDPRFQRDYVPMQSIVTSSGQNDSGLFELNFRDERYLPFEGAGVISKWRFELPKPDDFPPFDYNTISDIVLHVKYTARDGGEVLKTAATGLLKKAIEPAATTSLGRLFSLRQEFPSEWHRFLHPRDADEKQTLTLALTPERFPFQFRGRKIEIREAHLFLKLKNSSQYNDEKFLTFDFQRKADGPSSEAIREEIKVKGSPIPGLPYSLLFKDKNEGFGQWSFAIGRSDIRDMRPDIPEWLRQKKEDGNEDEVVEIGETKYYRLNTQIIEDICLVCLYSLNS